MPTTLGLVANIFNEANALPGWLETHLPFFDDVRVLHAGPQGEYSSDGTIELLERWHVPVEFCAIDEGFGVVRTRAIRMSPCDWVMILDADERFFSVHRLMTCSGESTPPEQVDWILQSYDFRGVNLPNWENIARLGAGLRVNVTNTYDQGKILREIISDGAYDAVCSARRHWHDFGFRRPTQNWDTSPDWQMRILRNRPDLYYDPGTRMHERLMGAQKVYRADVTCGPFMDHFHFTFKKMEVEQRAHDIAVYDKIHKGETPPILEEFRKGKM